MKIPVIYKSFTDAPNIGYWDQALLQDIFDGKIWKPVVGFEFVQCDGLHESTDKTIAIYVIPARYCTLETVEKINREINEYESVIVILTGDEENVFPHDKLNHSNMLLYVQSPHIGVRADKFIPNGYSNDTRELVKRYGLTDKKWNWFFAGQVTHKRRKQCVEALREVSGDHFLLESSGFTQGMDKEMYIKHMKMAAVAPCPSGAVIPDTFRLYEALESGVMPLVDSKSPRQDVETKDYFNRLFDEENLPFPLIEDWSEVKGYIQYYNDTYPKYQNKVFAWWQKYKRDLVYAIQEDLRFLLNRESISAILHYKKFMEDLQPNDAITVLVPTSPISSHPDTSIIEETIKSVRDRLPTAEIIIMIDGVRTEQEHYQANYQEYIRRLLHLCNDQWTNVLPLIFDEHNHQASMTRIALKEVKTLCVMFVEHDTPLCEDIPFGHISQSIFDGTANVVRLNHEASILPDHKHMMLDDSSVIQNGIPLVRTAQWSQRPHIASTEFYKWILDTYFTSSSRTMIEDKMHSVLHTAYITRGLAGWNKFKVWLYTPEGDQKRSYNLDGRKSDPKFDMVF